MEYSKGKGKVITVVGAGGNRDKGKRPIMAKEAAKASDRVIITSDNPRFEEPQEIINDMLAGLDAEDMKKNAQHRRPERSDPHGLHACRKRRRDTRCRKRARKLSGNQRSETPL